MSISRERLLDYTTHPKKYVFKIEVGNYEKVFWIGNSGMRVYVSDEPWELHFTPNGSSLIPESTIMKYYNGLLYIKAFDAFVSYARENCSVIQPLIVRSTNCNFFRFNKCLFNDVEKQTGINNGSLFISTNNDTYGFEINLPVFMNAVDLKEFKNTKIHKYLEIANSHIS